ncbi:Nucleolin 2 [Dendrobium catenatum]|uniref:Nucleolin 2 n=1 Tax=Dendrobium catenatum TaxID=906689 RepID=A0A2I0W7D2_9ASPA|nr:Nucleolin 2 [Dendrobium catenatum]
MGKSRRKTNVAEATVPLPAPTKAAKNDKRRVEEAPEDRASSKKKKIETEQVDLSKKKVKKMKKSFTESPGEKKDEGRSSDFEYGVAEATVWLPPTKAAKNDKRGVEEAPEDRASSKKHTIETEQVDQNKKKVKKRKKTLSESLGEKKDEGKSSDFEYGFAETPITIPLTKAAAKGKRGTEEATKKQASSKIQILELEKVGLSKKMVKKLKKTLIECPTKKNDETWCSDFGVEKSGAPKTKPVSASKKKPELNDGSSKSDSDEEVGKPVKSNDKAAIAVSKKKGDSSDSSSESDSGEEVEETGNKRMDLLPDNAKIKDAPKISEKEPETPAKRNEESGTKRLFVGNLPSEVTKDDLLDFFKMSGEVMEIRLAATEDGSFRGFGHVEFGTEAGARAVTNCPFLLLISFLKCTLLVQFVIVTHINFLDKFWFVIYLYMLA